MPVSESRGRQAAELEEVSKEMLKKKCGRASMEASCGCRPRQES